MWPEHTVGARRRRIYSEFVPPARLRSAPLLANLARRRIQLVVAVQPMGWGAIEAVVGDARAAGVDVALWPMLSDADGRWASVTNAEAFATHARAGLQTLALRGLLPQELCLDLEPPIATVRRWTDLSRGPKFPRGDRAWAAEVFTNLVGEAATLGVRTWASVVPLILTEPPASHGWQQILGTPVDALPLTHVSPMIYSSLLTGYARGWLTRDHAAALVWLGALACVRRYDARASVSLGAVGSGALGDEAMYRDPTELRDDVALARLAGIDDIALFDLSGALARGPVEAWLDALTEPGPAATPPRPSRRVRALLATARLGARLGEAWFGPHSRQ